MAVSRGRAKMAGIRQSRPDSGLGFQVKVLDRLRVGYHESRRCSRETYPETYITKYTSIRRTYEDSHSQIMAQVFR
jgi:hypothetical protein